MGAEGLSKSSARRRILGLAPPGAYNHHQPGRLFLGKQPMSGVIRIMGRAKRFSGSSAHQVEICGLAWIGDVGVAPCVGSSAIVTLGLQRERPCDPQPAWRMAARKRVRVAWLRPARPRASGIPPPAISSTALISHGVGGAGQALVQRVALADSAGATVLVGAAD